MKRISIVVPTYNAEQYLAESLFSIHRQTVKPYEVVVVDDCSTDRTKLIAESCGKLYFHDINFQLVSHEKNLGIGATRQDGIQAATGEFIGFLSSDDSYMPKFIETTLQYLDQHPYAATFTDYYRCNGNLKPFEVFRCPYYRTWEEFRILVINWALQINMFVNFSSIVIPRTWFSVMKFDVDHRHGEDLVFLLGSLLKSCFWRRIPHPLLKYRIHLGQGSARWVGTERDRLILNVCSKLKALGVPDNVVEEAMQIDKQERQIYHSPLRRVLRRLKRMAFRR